MFKILFLGSSFLIGLVSCAHQPGSQRIPAQSRKSSMEKKSNQNFFWGDHDDDEKEIYLEMKRETTDLIFRQERELR